MHPLAARHFVTYPRAYASVERSQRRTSVAVSGETEGKAKLQNFFHSISDYEEHNEASFIDMFLEGNITLEC